MPQRSVMTWRNRRVGLAAALMVLLATCVGSFGGGLVKYSFFGGIVGGELNRQAPDTGAFTAYLSDPNDPDSLFSNFFMLETSVCLTPESTERSWCCSLRRASR